MYDVITIGNAMIDAFLTIHDSARNSKLREQDSLLCFPRGEKILLDKCTFELGGDACNVAVGLSRLGLKTAIIAETGNDEFAQKIIHGLNKEQVDTNFVQQTNTSASFAVGITIAGERTIFTEHVTREHDFDFSSLPAKWLYLTSLGNEWIHVYDSVKEYVQKTGIFLAFNPGTRQLKYGIDRIQSLLPLTSILFVNKEEAGKILEEDVSDISYEDILHMVKQLGPKIVVLTDGAAGSFVMTENGEVVSKGSVDAPVVEKTGAGDAYSSGFLAGRVLGEDVQTSMLWGTMNAAAVIGKIGAQPGLLTREEMEGKNH